MKIGAALAADLGILTAALDEPGADVLHSLHHLGVDAQAAVPTYLGLSVTVDGSDPPFTFTTLEDGAADDVRTSLRLTLPGVGDGRASPSVALILYARHAGNICRPHRGPGVANRPPAQRFRARSASQRPCRVGHRDISANGVGHQSGDRCPHRPRPHAGASSSGTGHPS